MTSTAPLADAYALLDVRIFSQENALPDIKELDVRIFSNETALLGIKEMEGDGAPCLK